MAVDYGAIARALDRVDSVGRERLAAGRALSDLSTYGYAQLGDLSRFSDVVNPTDSRRRLDEVRDRLEGLYPNESEADGDPPTSAWSSLRKAIMDAYSEIAGIDAAAGYQRGISISDDFAAALDELPDRLATVGAGVGSVVGGIGGFFGGFLSKGWPLVLALVAVFLLYRRFVA